MRLVGIAILAVALCLGCGGIARASSIAWVGDTRNDSSCDYDTIQQAINDSSVVLIIVTAEHSYTAQALSISNRTLTIIAQTDGLGCGNFPFVTSFPQVAISGTGHSGDNVMSISGTSDVTLQNFEISGSTVPDDGDGGGIKFYGSGSLTLAVDTIQGNRGGYGAGLYVDTPASGTAKVTIGNNVYIHNNTAHVSGGGIRIAGNTRLIAMGDSTSIAFNEATTAYGGGIEVVGPARADLGMYGSVYGNRAVNGGGIAAINNGHGEPVVRMFPLAPSKPITVNGNTASALGGGIYLEGPQASVCLFATRLDGNSADDGAAIYSYAGGIYPNAANAPNAFKSPDRLGPSCGPETPEALGGVTYCNPGLHCNYLRGNFTNDPASGSIIAEKYGEFIGSRLRLEHNDAQHVIGMTTASVRLSHCALVDNHTIESLAYTTDSLDPSDYHNCTFAHNDIGGGWPVINFFAAGSVRLERSIVSEPGHETLWFTPTAFVTGANASAQNLMTNDLASFPNSHSDPTIVKADPVFANVTDGDYHLRRGSPALDFAIPEFVEMTLDAYKPSDLTMDAVDIASAANRFGTEDLGAYEQTNTDRIFASANGDEDPVVDTGCRFHCE